MTDPGRLFAHGSRPRSGLACLLVRMERAALNTVSAYAATSRACMLRGKELEQSVVGRTVELYHGMAGTECREKNELCVQVACSSREASAVRPVP